MTEAQAPFERLALIGVGLIGSSLARAIRRGGLAAHIAGCTRSEASRDKCLELGIVDSAHLDPAECVAGADLVILCSHLGSYSAIAEAIAPVLKPGAIVSDVGSVKSSVLRQLAPLLPEGVHLVPGHPVSGTENSGPESGFAELFDDRWCILTPDAATDPAAVERVAGLWRAIGSRVEIMDAEHHDLVLAVTSHLPHLIAYNIVGTAADLESVTKSEVIKYSAGGFRDFTRIAASEPEFWRDVFLANKDAVLETLGRFTEDLIALQRMIRWDEGDRLFDLFTRTREVRRRIIAAGQETAAPDFGRRGAGED
ncbi:MAG: prephenate/arogenate dehydrogenase family protein [Alphaproteobacteria bacterium]|jgi:cyclohexadieny/prephenate dehydrogenase|nr:prephenate/arogenate dehydrogenase family protein [Alphaproteobacteria bacterium]